MSSGSFSFCGVDISTLGLSYAPGMSDTFVYRPAEAQSHIESFDGKDGGYYYGSWYEPKDFILRCYFEETSIDKGIMGKVYSLFHVGKSGKLVFERRPWCYYYATVTDPIQTDFTNYLNGLITIHMKAMYPFARSDIMTSLRTGKDHEMLMANSAVFDKPDMELPNQYDLNKTSRIILANPGTERAALGFEIWGDTGTGVVIENKTTGQKCKMVAITPAETTNKNKKVLVDPISGKVILHGAGTKELAFKYHEFGFLELESAYPAVRDIYVKDSDGSSMSVNLLRENVIGKYIFLKTGWSKIIDQPDKNTLIAEKHSVFQEGFHTMVESMNEITITPITTMNIHLNFIFKPTYA